MAYDAVIFDMDGTLIDSERLVIEAGLAAFRDCGLPERRDVLEALIGTVGDFEEALIAAFGPGMDVAGFERRFAASYREAKAAGMPLRPGAREMLAHLAELSLPVALATNTTTAGALDSLASAGLLYAFEERHVWGRDRVARPKPAPDLFLAAAEGLRVKPVRCLAFEDSDAGTAAALAAGMTVVQVPDQRPAGTRDAHHLADSLFDGARAAGLLPRDP